MAQHGMRLVWSARSNVSLYGEPTRVDLAIQQGVSTLAIAPDWWLGGSVNLLEELRYARDLDRARFGGILSDRRLFEMVTIDAARALGVDAALGSLEPVKRSDSVALGGDLADYDASVLAGSSPPFLPLAPPTTCP